MRVLLCYYAQADLAYMGGKLDDITVVVARVAAVEEVRLYDIIYYISFIHIHVLY